MQHPSHLTYRFAWGSNIVCFVAIPAFICKNLSRDYKGIPIKDGGN